MENKPKSSAGGNAEQKAPKRGVDLGIYTSAVTLEHKLEQLHDGKGKEGVWNMRRLPQNLGKGETPDRLFFAADGAWRGCFRIVPEVLFNPEDEERPYSLLFDLSSWKEIPSSPVKKFRGFRYLEGMPE